MASAHRRESWDKISEIASAIKKIAEQNDVRIIIPMHKNPIVREAFTSVLCDVKNVDLIEPLPYISFCKLMNHVDIILSDSSGAEEEGPTLGKPTLILRSVTERPEATYTGTAVLVGTSAGGIVRQVNKVIKNLDYYKLLGQKRDHYGDGKATERVVEAIANFFGMGHPAELTNSLSQSGQGTSLCDRNVIAESSQKLAVSRLNFMNHQAA